MKKFGFVVLVVFFLCLQGVAQSFEQYKEIPSILLKQPDSLVNYLINNEKSDYQKAICIHDFLISQFNLTNFHVNSLNLPNPNEILLKKEITGYELSTLYTFLCEKAGIKAFTLEGYSPDLFFKQGQTYALSTNYWNAIQINKIWLLTDIARDFGYFTWHKTIFNFICQSKKVVFKKNPSHQFLLQSPDSFVFYNLSAFPYWQMVPCEIPLSVFESGNNAITNEFNRMGSIPCYNLRDSILKESRVTGIEKEYMRATNAIQFNPNNSLLLALTVMRDANTSKYIISMNDTASIKLRNSKWVYARTLLNRQKEALTIQQQHVLRSFKLFDSITSNFFKTFTKDNEKIISMNNSYMERNINETKSLSIENKELLLVNKNLIKENIDDVKRTKKKNTQDELNEIRENLRNTKENKKLITTNKSYINDLRKSNEEERQLFINKNFDTILAKHDVNNILFQKATSFRKMNPFQTDTLFLQYLNRIRMNKLDEKTIRKQTKDEGLTYVKNNSILIDSVYKVNKTLIKDNKRILKRNKRLSAEDYNETLLFAEENKSFLDDNNTMIQTNTAKMKDNKNDNIFMQNENKKVKRELKIIRKLSKQEKKLSAFGISVKSKNLEMTKTSLTKLMEYCSMQIRK